MTFYFLFSYKTIVLNRSVTFFIKKKKTELKIIICTVVKEWHDEEKFKVFVNLQLWKWVLVTTEVLMNRVTR